MLSLVKQIFILGNHIQALGIARQCHAINCKVTLFTTSGYSISRFSQAVHRTFFFDSRDDLLAKLLRIKIEEKEIFIIPTNDDMVSFLRDNHAILNPYYYIGIPQIHNVDIFYNKRKTYQFAENNEIPSPKSWYPNTIEELASLSKQISYPVIIKPAVMHSFHAILRKKAFKCNNKAELLERAEYIDKFIPVKELIVQEFLDGGPKNLFSYGVFALEGKPIVSLMANRIRQNPMTFGNSTTFAVTCHISEIKKQAEKILEQVNYSGVAEVEFMYDETHNAYKFLEINPRPWKWHTLSHAFNFGFVSEWIKHLNNQPLSEKRHIEDPVTWSEKLTDFTVILKEFIKVNNILPEAVKSYKIKNRVHAVWSLKDPLPAIMYILMAPVLFFKRH